MSARRGASERVITAQPTTQTVLAPFDSEMGRFCLLAGGMVRGDTFRGEADMATKQANAIDVLVSDHRKVDRLFEEYEATSSPGLRRELADKMTRELSIHAAIEEQIFYPTVRQALPDGDPLVSGSLHEHQEVKELLAELERLEPQSREFDECVRRVAADVRHHVEEEETRMFPRFRQAIGEERLRDLAVALEAAKKIAPTRPHPHAPATPPANVIAGAAAGAVDRMRDRADMMLVPGSRKKTVLTVGAIVAALAGIGFGIARFVASRREEEEEPSARDRAIAAAKAAATGIAKAKVTTTALRAATSAGKAGVRMVKRAS